LSLGHISNTLHQLDEMASGGDDLGEAGVRPETHRVHDWVPEG
jgi:hypothetical protein